MPAPGAARFPHSHSGRHLGYDQSGRRGRDFATGIHLIEALELSGPGDAIELFCLGTCPRPSGEHVREGDLNRGLQQWKFGGDAVTLALDAQEQAFDHMARMLSKHVDRRCPIVRFPHGDVTAETMNYLDLDETRDEAMAALISQAETDAYATLSRFKDRTNSDGQLMKSLLNRLPDVQAEPDALAALSPRMVADEATIYYSNTVQGENDAQLPR